MASTHRHTGSGWNAFAGIVLMLAGALDIMNGLWALDHKNTSPKASLLTYANLETWGWIMLLWGILVLFAGILVLGRWQFGRWTGIIAASVAIIVNMTWIVAYAFAALTGIFLAVLVLCALIVHGGREQPAL